MVVVVQEIAELHVQRSAAHSLFLVTVPANENIRNSIGMDLILRKGLQVRPAFLTSTASRLPATGRSP